ncbi:MAG: ABC transporter substrate-binding protein [Candidatus Woesearchaeota archaeon]|nr:ABC transporter substrate-binding protein [Candidatus Woesearchaeota archaeon]
MFTPKKWLLCILFLLVGCTITGNVTIEEPIRIGGAFALTGWAAAWGEEDLNGAKLAIEEANAQGGVHGKTIELIVQDTQSDNDATLTATHALVTIHDVAAIIGPTWFETYQSATTISDQGTLMITPSGVIEGVQLETFHPYVYGTWYSFEEELATMMEHLAVQGMTNIVLIMGLTPYWTTIATIVNRDAENYGLTVLATYESEEVEDYRTLLLQADELNPDAILFGMDSERSMFDMLKQRQELGITARFVGQEYLLPFATDSEFSQYFEGVQIVAPAAIPAAFSQRYEERFGAPPKISASTAYDATNIVIEALRETDGSLQAMTGYLDTHTFDTVTYGNTGFKRNGGMFGGEFVVYEIHEGDAVLRNAAITE